MSTVLENIEDSETGFNKRVMVKGASEIVLGTCSHYIDEEGTKQVLSDSKKEEII
jgi:magnesium-transporting ATPase (P-type)